MPFPTIHDPDAAEPDLLDGLQREAAPSRASHGEDPGGAAAYEADGLEAGLTVLVELRLDRQGAEHVEAFERRAVADAAVQQVWRVSPGPDFVLVANCADMAAYHALTKRLFRQRCNVRNVKTRFAIRRSKGHHRAGPGRVRQPHAATWARPLVAALQSWPLPALRLPGSTGLGEPAGRRPWLPVSGAACLPAWAEADFDSPHVLVAEVRALAA